MLINKCRNDCQSDGLSTFLKDCFNIIILQNKKYWLLLLSIIHTLWGTEHCNKVFRYNSMLQFLLNTSPLSNMMGFTENFYRRKTKRWMGKETWNLLRVPDVQILTSNMAIRNLTIEKKLDWNCNSKGRYHKHTIVKYYQPHDFLHKNVKVQT